MRLLASALVVLLPAIARCDAGTSAASFLEIPAGARPAALGGAYGALADDAFSPLYNPAGLASPERPQAALSHLAYLEGMSYEFLGAAVPFGRGGAGLAVQYFRPGSVASRDDLGNPGADASGYSAAYTAAYGVPLAAGLSVGASLKLIDSRLDGVGARAFDGDLGARWRARGDLSLSAALANLAGSEMTYITQSDKLARAVRAGAAYQAFRWLTVALEGSRGLDEGSADLRTGVEWTLTDGLFLRGGYQQAAASGRSGAAGLIAGAGISLLGQQVDYAWVPFGALGDTQYLSLRMTFGASEEQ